jgi:hypothetical protein
MTCSIFSHPLKGRSITETPPKSSALIPVLPPFFGYSASLAPPMPLSELIVPPGQETTEQQSTPCFSGCVAFGKALESH